MPKPLNRPFRALRALKTKVVVAENEPARGNAQPSSFEDEARADGVSPAARDKARVKPPDEHHLETGAREVAVEHAFSVRVDANIVEARRDDTEPVVFSWLQRQEPTCTLDLHGKTAEQARRAVQRFVRARAKRGDEVILIVTGRGRRSQGTAVLQCDAPEWLTEHSLQRHVRAFVTAPPRYGAQGALLVLLAPTL